MPDTSTYELESTIIPDLFVEEGGRSTLMGQFFPEIFGLLLDDSWSTGGIIYGADINFEKFIIKKEELDDRRHSCFSDRRHFLPGWMMKHTDGVHHSNSISKYVSLRLPEFLGR